MPKIHRGSMYQILLIIGRGTPNPSSNKVKTREGKLVADIIILKKPLFPSSQEKRNFPNVTLGEKEKFRSTGLTNSYKEIPLIGRIANINKINPSKIIFVL